MNVVIDLDIDFALLAQQKATLISVIDQADEDLDATIIDHLDGLLNLLDGLQDTAADMYGEAVIFPHLADGDGE